MTLPVVLHRAARAEFDEAADWYEQRQAGLGAAFVLAVHQVLDRIAAQPDFYPVVYQDVREALLSRYPYAIYYRDQPDRVLLLSIFHAARDPSIWQRRS